MSGCRAAQNDNEILGGRCQFWQRGGILAPERGGGTAAHGEWSQARATQRTTSTPRTGHARVPLAMLPRVTVARQ